jgi:hypothetical protein
MERVPGSDAIPGFFDVPSERVASVIDSASAFVVFSHDGFWWLLVLEGSASGDFAGDLVDGLTTPSPVFADMEKHRNPFLCASSAASSFGTQIVMFWR